MGVAGVAVIMFVLVLVTGLYPDQIEHHRPYAAFSANTVCKLVECHCCALEHDSFQSAAVIQCDGCRASDQIMMRVLQIGQATGEAADPAIIDVRQVADAVLIVRRQIIWRKVRLRLAECGPRLGVDVRRRACGVASADVRWSFA